MAGKRKTTETLKMLLAAFQGNKAEIARAVGVSTAYAYRWQKMGYIPETYVLEAGRAIYQDDSESAEQFALQALKEAQDLRCRDCV